MLYSSKLLASAAQDVVERSSGHLQLCLLQGAIEASTKKTCSLEYQPAARRTASKPMVRSQIKYVENGVFHSSSDPPVKDNGNDAHLLASQEALLV